MVRKLLLGVLVLTIALTAANTSQANPKVYEKTLTSAAWILTINAKKDFGVGSGVVIDLQKKWVLTNYHVVGDAADFMVFFPATQNGKIVVDPKHYITNMKKLGIQGKVLQRDKQRDLALIELNSLPTGVKAVTMASASPKPGETLHTVGNSGMRERALWRYSRGEVRQVYAANYKSTVTGAASLDIKATIVETQMPINPGDSGGPVVNDQGQLVAVNQGISTDRSLLAWSIDINEIRTFLKTGATPTRANATPTPERSMKK